MALDDLTDAMVIVSSLLAKSAIVIMNDALHKKEISNQVFENEEA